MKPSLYLVLGMDRFVVSKHESDWYCAAGKTEIPAKFCSAKEPSVLRASDAVIAQMGEMGALAYRIADLTIAFDQSGTVGGKVNAVEITTDGSIRWLAHPTCKDGGD